MALLGVLLFCVSCTSIQPIRKIGLIAPFEGLYRETGYASLDAMRTAIEECTPPNMQVIPLALDNSGSTSETARTVEKLLQDPALIAVIGPYDYATTAAAMSTLTDTEIPWRSPAAVNAEGVFVDPRQDSGYVDDIVSQMVQYAIGQGADSVTVVGYPDGWSLDETASEILQDVGDRIHVIEQANDSNTALALAVLSEVGSNDAVVWLGSADGGANLAAELHEEKPSAAFWLSPMADIAIFSEHYRAIGDVYWVSWIMPEYNTELQHPNSGAALSQLTYLAACEALSKLDAAGTHEPVRLVLSAHQLISDGSSTLLEPDAVVTE